MSTGLAVSKVNRKVASLLERHGLLDTGLGESREEVSRDGARFSV